MLVAWYPSVYAPRTGGAYDSHHRTAGIACRTRRRSGGVAAYGERAATAGDAGDRVPRFGFAPTNGTDGSCVSPGPGQNRLRRGPEGGDRIPLGRFSIRAIAGARRGASPPSSGRDFYRRLARAGIRGKGGHLNDSDRLRLWGRSGEGRSRGQPKPPRG